jgi:hypothetical protein
VSIGLCGSLPIPPIPEGARGMRRNVCSDDRAELRQHGLPRTAHRRSSKSLHEAAVGGKTGPQTRTPRMGPEQRSATLATR